MSARDLIIDGYNLMYAAGYCQVEYAAGDLMRCRARLLAREAGFWTAGPGTGPRALPVAGVFPETGALAGAGACEPAQTRTRGLARILRNHWAFSPKPEATR